MRHLAINGGEPVRTRPMPVYPQLGEREVEAATRVVRSNNLSSQFGNETENLERAFSEYSGAKHVIATSCGTTALQVALAALGIGTGDEVIVPAYTFLATATSVLMQNGVPVFADSEPLVQGMDTSHVEKLLTDRTRAIMPVHANGFPMNMDPLMALARSKGLSVIEDCSHAHGGEYKGRMVGTIGHINAFSLQQKKNLSAGEGGLITTDDDELAQQCRAIRSFGKVDLGYNYRMSEIHAAICAVRLKDLDEANDLRIRNADHSFWALRLTPDSSPRG
ncbi:MAG: DegT/DnrJ/EryC1/StrS family aminotransferase [Planctomycetota bacterium]|nr:DegT/DnrJ/EryC1/StrS family aminotransferase [Planctomycetota bacterium]MDP7132310.1 DegT/DnrJ/EryC1/StrS family aminotransferase [Planctomycetota bacterium]MDP7250076.1 DegT/DnrJ/EryC1/StrS family aminotransferase [Planctomycetota bacterium]